MSRLTVNNWARLASWYFDKFPLQRGKGLLNKVFGRFLAVELPGGGRIRICCPMEYIQRILLSGAEYEPELTRFISTCLGPGNVFLDVGSNLGYYSILGAFKVGNTGQVHAFEPSPAQFRHLQLNKSINQLTNLKTNQTALADTSGDRSLYLTEGWNHGIHSLGKANGRTLPCKIKCTTLDAYVLANNLPTIDLMKVDVEGAELLVFQGGARTLEKSPPRIIIFEACEELTTSLGYSTTDMGDFLRQFGYKLFRLEEAGPLVQVIGSLKEEFSNIVAIHDTASHDNE